MGRDLNKGHLENNFEVLTVPLESNFPINIYHFELGQCGQYCDWLQTGRCGVLSPEGAGEFSPEHADPLQRTPIQRASGSISLG